MELIVTRVSGKAVTLSVEPRATILDVKRQVEAAWGIPARQQRLTYDMGKLDDSFTVAGYDLPAGATLELGVVSGCADDDSTDSDAAPTYNDPMAY